MAKYSTSHRLDSLDSLADAAAALNNRPQTYPTTWKLDQKTPPELAVVP